MSAVFLKVLNMSITASWLILAVVLTRLILKKAPKWIPCLLWELVAIRLICPFSFESVLSLIPSSETIPVNIAEQHEPAITSGITIINEAVNPVVAESFTPAPTDSANPLQIIIPVAAIIWIAGIVIMLTYALLSYLKLKKTVSVCVPIGERLLACDEVKAPFILGVFRPVIYVPSSMSGKTLEHVIRHEKAHLQRHDHWWKPLGFLLLSVYWFNPLCWIAYILLCRDIEMACDEKVIRDMDKNDIAAYSQALLDCSFPRKRIAACPLAFGEVGVKERVKGVLNYKKPSFWIILAAILVCIVLAVCLLTNPKSSDAASTSVAASFEGDGYVGISYEGRRYVPFCAISNSARGELLGYVGDDPKDQIYTWKGYSPEEWIISFYHSGLMDTSMLMRETHVTDIPSQVTSEYSWNNSPANNLSPGEDATEKSFHLTIGSDGVKRIEITTPDASGGCENADGSLYRKGEQIWLEPLNRLEDLRGVTITALDENGTMLWTASIPNTEENRGFTRLTQDGWTITNIRDTSDVDFNIRYELGATAHDFTSTPSGAKAGEKVEIKTDVLFDADIHVYVDGQEIGKTHYDSDYWGYSFIMPDKDVLVTARFYTKDEIRGTEAVDLAALRAKYPEYFDLSTSKGLEVYVWQMAQDSYSCGLLPGTNRNRTTELANPELMNLKGASIAEMRAILSTYDIDEKDVIIIPWQNPVSSYIAEYWISQKDEDPAVVEKRKQEYIDGIRQMLFGTEYSASVKQERTVT